MKKVVLALGFVAALALATPAPAHAYFSLGIGLPGFGLFVNEPGSYLRLCQGFDWRG